MYGDAYGNVEYKTSHSKRFADFWSQEGNGKSQYQGEAEYEGDMKRVTKSEKNDRLAFAQVSWCTLYFRYIRELLAHKKHVAIEKDRNRPVYRGIRDQAAAN